MGARAGAPQRTRPRCAHRDLHRLPFLGSPASNAPCQELGVQTPRPRAGSRAALARGAQAPASALGARAREQPRERRARQAAHPVRGGRAPGRSWGTASAALPGGCRDRGTGPRETLRP